MNIVFELDKGNKMNIKDLLDSDINKKPKIYCAECGGRVELYSNVLAECKEKGCLGCFLCGRVTPENDVKRIIEKCARCYGGDNQCVDDCPNHYMRSYYNL